MENHMLGFRNKKENFPAFYNSVYLHKNIKGRRDFMIRIQIKSNMKHFLYENKSRIYQYI